MNGQIEKNGKVKKKKKPPRKKAKNAKTRKKIAATQATHPAVKMRKRSRNKRKTGERNSINKMRQIKKTLNPN